MASDSPPDSTLVCIYVYIVYTHVWTPISTRRQRYMVQPFQNRIINVCKESCILYHLSVHSYININVYGGIGLYMEWRPWMKKSGGGAHDEAIQPDLVCMCIIVVVDFTMYIYCKYVGWYSIEELCKHLYIGICDFFLHTYIYGTAVLQVF